MVVERTSTLQEVARPLTPSGQEQPEALRSVISYPFVSAYRDGGGDTDVVMTPSQTGERGVERGTLSYAQLKELDSSLSL